jgi:hypothetical protein
LQAVPPAPPQAKAENLSQTAAVNILRPALACKDGLSVLDIATVSRVDLNALQALNIRGPSAKTVPAGNVAAK